MDYKNTLNLPRTDFPMKADLVKREPDRLKQWEDAKLYAAIQDRPARAGEFVLHDGPPFANGEVHIGTAGNKILKDFIVKYKTLREFRAPYVPGWDCHGLPIEYKVMQEMRAEFVATLADTDAFKTSTSAQAAQVRTMAIPFEKDPMEVRARCEKYARAWIYGGRESGDGQMKQFKRLGVLGDWENPYLTMAKEYESEELRLFADIVERGFVYRGKKPVYWCIPCHTALAEAEVEYKDHVSQSVYVKFPLVGHPGTSVVIWTTTPWTLPANLAIAYNSTFSYSLVLVGEEQFVVSALLLPTVAEKCGWKEYQIVRSLDGGHLSQMEFQHPFCKRTGKFFRGDSFVDNVTGTGFVHVAPGHGLDDYNLGIEHDLKIYSPVDDDGKFTYTSDLPQELQMPAEMIGKSILEKHGKSEANEAVLHELRTRRVLLHQENYRHSYPHCWRSKTPIIFRTMVQWFIRTGHEKVIADLNFGLSHPPTTSKTLQEFALGEIDHVDWIPDWGKSRIRAAVEKRPSWCISRQRAWGVPIPAFFAPNDEVRLYPEVIREFAKLVSERGTNVWWEMDVQELWRKLRPSRYKEEPVVSKSNDTLDVWIDSGSSSRSVLMRRPELHHASPIRPQGSATGATSPPFEWQADMYLEGSDQHRGWFQSSLLLSLAGNGAAPYKTVLTHGFMVDADREKISKSKQGQGGYEKPQTSDTYVKKWGADIVRLWVASQDFRNDIIVSEERISKVAETYRVLRNALRYQLSNLYDFDPAKHAVPDERLTGLDRWILGEFSQLEQDVIDAYDGFEFHVVYQRVSQFVAVELSAIYHDVVKDRLYTDPADSARRRSTQTALHRMVVGLCKMLAPILAFTADEAWEFVPGKTAKSAHLLTWQPQRFERSKAEQVAWKALFEQREYALLALEQARQLKTIGKALDAQVVVVGPPGSVAPLRENVDTLRELLNVSQLALVEEDPKPLASGGTTIASWRVTKAAGQKCERCWHWETDVGAQAEHPTICGRCVKAVQESTRLTRNS